MKLNGIFGTGSGKVGASVWAVSSGVQIVRPYQPKVSNPNTDAQVAQRAKLKLMSQLAADLASIIAFKKEGLVSARNRFVSANIGLVTFENGQAGIELQNIDLTGSSAPLPIFTATEETPRQINVGLSLAAPADIDAVLYALVRETDNKKLEVLQTVVATTPGEARNFAAQLQYGEAYDPDDKCIFTYGIKYTDAASRQRYADYVANVEDGDVTLDVNVRDFLSGASFTMTRVDWI